jgi:hypothetical protein
LKTHKFIYFHWIYKNLDETAFDFDIRENIKNEKNYIIFDNFLSSTAEKWIFKPYLSLSCNKYNLVYVRLVKMTCMHGCLFQPPSLQRSHKNMLREENHTYLKVYGHVSQISTGEESEG